MDVSKRRALTGLTSSYEFLASFRSEVHEAIDLSRCSWGTDPARFSVSVPM